MSCEIGGEHIRAGGALQPSAAGHVVAMISSLPRGFRAIIFGASGAIGAALADALEAEPGCAEVVRLSRRSVPAVELTDESTIAAAAAALKAGGPFSLMIDATGALSIDGVGPEKRLADLDAARLARVFAINAIGPALLLKHFAELLPRSGRCVFASLSARVGSIGDNALGGWYGYRASKAALNQLLRTASIEIARKRPESLVLALHPGTVRGKLSSGFIGPADGMSPAESAARLLAVIDAAQPGESGRFADYAGLAIPW